MEGKATSGTLTSLPTHQNDGQQDVDPAKHTQHASLMALLEAPFTDQLQQTLC